MSDTYWIQQNRSLLWGRLSHKIFGLEHNRSFRENIWKKQDLLFHLWNNYQEPEDFFEAWNHVAAFRRKLIKDREEFPEKEPPEYFDLYFDSRPVKEIDGANWALNWKLEENEREEAGYNIPVQYNNCIKMENFEDIISMDDMFLTLVNILKNDSHLSKLKMLQLFKLVLDSRYNHNDETTITLNYCLYREWERFDLFSTKDCDIESRDMVFRMMVDIVTIQKLERNREKQHQRMISRLQGSSFMTTDRIKDRLIEIKELLETFDVAFIAIELEHFDENRLSKRLSRINRILGDLEQARVAEQYIEEHGPIIDTWTQSKIFDIEVELTWNLQNIYLENYDI